MKFSAPRGTHDLFGNDSLNLRLLEDSSRKTFSIYNFSEIIVPVFEDAGLFTRSIGGTTDIVEKEMYVFEDRKGRKLALRPEGTASVVRACIENQLFQNMAVPKLFYMGSMFRYERPQAGRYREFFQIGAEYFANPEPQADAEIILLAKDILEGFGLKGVKTHIHSIGCSECRNEFRKALIEYFKQGSKALEELCDDCKRRIETNPLRVLDCKIDNHKFACAPKMEQHLCEPCKTHFNSVKSLLDKNSCQYIVDHKLVRGLDYYTRTVFEMRSDLVGSQDALAAGGRYDNLVSELGGSQVPAVGFALGTERVMMARQKMEGYAPPASGNIIFVAAVSETLLTEAFGLAQAMRNKLKDNTVIEGPFAGKSLKSQLKLADRLGASEAIIFGDDEFVRGTVILRNMKSTSIVSFNGVSLESQEQKEVNLHSILER